MWAIPISHTSGRQYLVHTNYMNMYKNLLDFRKFAGYFSYLKLNRSYPVQNIDFENTNSIPIQVLSMMTCFRCTKRLTATTNDSRNDPVIKSIIESAITKDCRTQSRQKKTCKYL